MLAQTYHNNFDAYLKLVDGKILAFGKASIEIEKHAVSFTSSFVPLYPMGTKMEIVRLHKGKKIHSFTGGVYLSDKHFMNIVSVSDVLLPGSELCYCGELNFPMQMHQIDTDNKNKLFSMFNNKKKKPMDAIITELTPHRLHFQINDNINSNLTESIEKKVKKSVGNKTFIEERARFQKGMKFAADLAGALPKISIEFEIIEPFYFGAKAWYSCDITNISQDDRYALGKFLWKYNLENNTVFK